MIDYWNFFGLLGTAALWCFGFYTACQYEIETEKHINSQGKVEYFDHLSYTMLLWWFGYMCAKLPWYLNKPLCKCVTCMASIHGTLIFFLFYPMGTIQELLITWPLFIVSLAGLNQLIANKFDVE